MEYVLSGHRLKLSIPKEGVTIVFAPSGIKTPSRAQPAAPGKPAIAAEPYGGWVRGGGVACLPAPGAGPLFSFRSSGFHPQALHAPAPPSLPPNHQLAHGRLLTALQLSVWVLLAAEEAVAFTREHCMQRDAEVTIENMDRGGTFLGTITISGATPQVRTLEGGCVWEEAAEHVSMACACSSTFLGAITISGATP